MIDWYSALLVFVEGFIGVFVVLIVMQLSINIFAKIASLLAGKKVQE